MTSAAYSLNLKSVSKAATNGVRVTPLVMFSILDHYSRRESEQEWVIGTLLGRACSDGTVEITSCYPVPHEEGEAMGVDTEFHKEMLEMHARVNSKDRLVGWYSTGSELGLHHRMIHDMYQQEHPNPVHLLVDVSLPTPKDASSPLVPMSAYVGKPIRLMGEVTGFEFRRIPLAIDHSSLELLLGGGQGEQEGKKSDFPLEDFGSLHSSLRSLRDMLDHISAHVDDVVAGKRQGDEKLGRTLAKSLSCVPHIDVNNFQKLVEDGAQDLLMLVYLSNLARAQLALTDRLDASM